MQITGTCKRRRDIRRRPRTIQMIAHDCKLEPEDEYEEAESEEEDECEDERKEEEEEEDEEE